MLDIAIPEDFWDDDSEGSISSWFFANGDRIEEGDLLAEVMNEKVASELYAPGAGVLEILVQAEEPVRKGQVVAKIAA